MKHIKLTLAAMIAVLGLSLTPLVADTASAATPKEELCKGSGGSWSGSTCTNANSGGVTVQGLIKDVVNVLLFIIGAVSVIMIIIGGLRYVTSNGDSSSMTSAKNTILYAVVGLIIAMAAYAIVNFVISAF